MALVIGMDTAPAGSCQLAGRVGRGRGVGAERVSITQACVVQPTKLSHPFMFRKGMDHRASPRGGKSSLIPEGISKLARCSGDHEHGAQLSASTKEN